MTIEPALTISEFESVNDRHYDDWLDIYQVSFPLNEQMRVSELNKCLRRRADGDLTAPVLLAALDGESNVAAIAMYELIVERDAGVLWYLAADPTRRGKGIGSWVYQNIVNRLSHSSEVKAIVIEVEMPAPLNDRPISDADRRIAFYRRNGAKLLNGIHYIQDVGWQEPVPMSVMIHPLQSMTPSDAFTVARWALGETLTATGTNSLE